MLQDEKEKKMQRPAGMSREAFALLDRTHPVVPSLTTDLRKKGDLQGLKEKRKAAQVTKPWTLGPPARPPALQDKRRTGKLGNARGCWGGGVS